MALPKRHAGPEAPGHFARPSTGLPGAETTLPKPPRHFWNCELHGVMKGVNCFLLLHTPHTEDLPTPQNLAVHSKFSSLQPGRRQFVVIVGLERKTIYIQSITSKSASSPACFVDMSGMMLGKGLVVCLDLFGCADFGFACSLPPPPPSYCVVL